MNPIHVYHIFLKANDHDIRKNWLFCYFNFCSLFQVVFFLRYYYDSPIKRYAAFATSALKKDQVRTEVDVKRSDTKPEATLLTME